MYNFQYLYAHVKNANRVCINIGFITAYLFLVQNIALSQATHQKISCFVCAKTMISLMCGDRVLIVGIRKDFDWMFSRKGINKIPAFPFPNAGPKSVDIYGWGIMQVFMTPSDLSKKNPDPCDYPYASSLIITRSVHSSSPYSKITV